MLNHRRCLKSLFLVVTVLFACSKPEETQVISNPEEFTEHIEGFTVGEISSHGEIAIRLSNPVEAKDINTLSLFEFNPKVKGHNELVNENVIVFKPNDPLKNDQEYKVSFNLGKVAKVPENKKKFSFLLHTTKQELEVVLGELESVSSK